MEAAGEARRIGISILRRHCRRERPDRSGRPLRLVGTAQALPGQRGEVRAHVREVTEAITIDPGERRDARWFGRAEIRDREAHRFHLPRVDSIARRLIEDWAAAGA